MGYFRLKKSVFAIICIILFLTTSVALAQITKLTQHKSTNQPSQPQQVRKLNPDNLEKTSYRIWLDWYQARKAGQQPPTPVLDLPNGIDAQEVKRVQAVWQQSQVKAHLAMVEKDVYQIWLDWYEQGQHLPVPDLTLPSGINEQEAKQVRAVWQRAQLKAQKNAKPQKSEQADNRTGELAQMPLELPPSSNSQFNNLSGNQPPQGISNLSRMSASVKPPYNSTLTAANTANLNLIHQYDNAGNSTVIGTKSLAYNADNQLTDMTDSNTGISVHMVYDADGNLVRKIVGPKDNFGNFIPASSVTTSYLVDTNNVSKFSQIVEETTTTNGVSTLSRVNTYGLDGIISLRQRINNQWETSFFHKDGQRSVRFLTNISGTITDTFDYDSYGNLINRTGTTPNYYLYTGERYDQDLGFYYLRARYLNTDTGRFLTMDDFEGDTSLPLSLHKYTYTYNDPINKIDPHGHFGIANDLVTRSILAVIPNPSLTIGQSVTGNNISVVVTPDNYRSFSRAKFDANIPYILPGFVDIKGGAYIKAQAFGVGNVIKPPYPKFRWVQVVTTNSPPRNNQTGEVYAQANVPFIDPPLNYPYGGDSRPYYYADKEEPNQFFNNAYNFFDDPSRSFNDSYGSNIYFRASLFLTVTAPVGSDTFVPLITVNWGFRLGPKNTVIKEPLSIYRTFSFAGGLQF